jgi:hypothetical protein
MKTKISVLTLVIGLATGALAQPALVAGTPPSVPIIPVPGNYPQNQPVPSPNGYQATGSPYAAGTNNINLANTNWSNGYHGNYGATNGNGGMTNGVYGNPDWSNANRDQPYTNNPSAADNLTNPNTVHHWWKWW